MKAVWFDGTLTVRDVPVPTRRPGEVLIRVARAGICNTDHEILKGYVPGFSGVLGHEFFGYVQETDDPALAGKRVTAEINCSCGTCDYCAAGMGRHCPARTVLGIAGRDGVFAEYVSVPRTNVIEIPSDIPDTEAVFVEPLAAACEILEQVRIEKGLRVLVLGDGKLGQMIARVLQPAGCDLTVVGKHGDKLRLLDSIGIRTQLLGNFREQPFDVVIEATGSPPALSAAIRCTRPRGTLVLKSTCARPFAFNPAPVVVNEITIVGSRCGRFRAALDFLARHRPSLGPLVAAEFSLADAVNAFEFSGRKGAMKVVLRP